MAMLLMTGRWYCLRRSHFITKSEVVLKSKRECSDVEKDKWRHQIQAENFVFIDSGEN